MIKYYVVSNIAEGRAWVQEFDTDLLASAENPNGFTWEDIAGGCHNTVEYEYDTLEEAEKAASDRNEFLNS